MADQFADGDGNLDFDINDVESSVVQNDQIVTENNQVAGSQENMVHGCDTMNTTQHLFDQKGIAVENSVSLTHDVVEYPKPAVENQHRNVRAMIGLRQDAVDESGAPSNYAVGHQNAAFGDFKPSACDMVDRNKATVEDSIDTSSDHVVDREKGTVEDHEPAGGMVDRRQSTVDSSTSNVMDFEVEQKSSVVVDRNKATVEDSIGASNDHIGETSTVQDPNKSGRAIVDRNKATVEDTASTSSDHVVDREKGTVEDHEPAGGMVDHRQLTVDSSTSNLTDFVLKQKGSEIVDRTKNTVEDTSSDHGETSTVKEPCLSGGAIVDRNKATAKDASDSIGRKVVDGTSTDCVDRERLVASNLVDREKQTVEDTEPSTQSNDHGVAGTTQIIGTNQPNHLVSSGTQSGIANNMVDREKKTFEDSLPSTQATSVNNPSVPDTTQPNHQVGGVELQQQFKQGCNIVDRRQVANSHPEEKWMIQLHVNNASNKKVIDHLPTSGQCFEWNKAVVFGRGVDVDIFINDDDASRQHVELLGQILPNGQVLFMTRNISRSLGYNLNGQNITDNSLWTPLNKGDQIKIAGLVFVVDIIPARAIIQNFVIEFKLPLKVHHSPVMTIPPNGNYIQSNLPSHNCMPMQPHWFLTGYPTNITGDMVEHVLQPYQEREGYVKFTKLRYLALEAVAVWEELGRALGLKDWQLTMIDRDHPNRSGEKSYQMLKTWVWCNPEQATLENLKTALEDITVGRADLAFKYCTFENNGTDHSP